MLHGESKRVLITGSNGMVGGNIAFLARESGWRIFTPSKTELNLRQSEKVLDYLAEKRIDSIIHCAAKVGGIAANVGSPADFIIENTQIDSSIISSARALGIQDFIYLASSCLYPRITSQPMKVDQILTSELEPTNEGYALAKIIGAKSVAAVALQDRLNWRVLIPSNLYGPRDKFDEGTSHLVPAVIRKIHRAILNNVESVEIWGNGEAKREFTFVGDIAQFIVNRFHELGKWPLLMNIGNGSDFSVNHYYNAVAKTLSYSGTFVHDMTKPVGMSQKLLDSSIAKEFGWEPKVNLETGLEITVRWYKENFAND